MRWWRVFIDKLRGIAGDAGVVGPRRRRARRYSYQTAISAKCESWPAFVDMVTANVSERGVFVPTSEPAALGEALQLELALPDGETLSLTGAVSSVVTLEQAAATGTLPGLGITLDLARGHARERFERLLATARGDLPRPAEIVDGQPSPRPPTTRPAPPTPPTSRLAPDDDMGGPERLVDAELRLGPGPMPKPTRLTESGLLPIPQQPPLEQVQRPPDDGDERAVTFKDASGLTPVVPRVARTEPGEGPIVGFDLGTTYTSMAAVVGKKVSILPWPDGAKQWPSVITFPEEHRCVVGPPARRALATDPAHTVLSPKRLLGRKYDDSEIAAFIGQVPYRTLPGPDSSVVVEIWGQQYAIPQLCAYILGEARAAAERALGQQVRRCVMTIPVSFDEARAKIFRRAGELVGLEVVAMIDEPSAAALANRFDRGFGGVVGVYDFGGGTFDFSIVDVSAGDFQVLATAGDTWLGGDDFDSVIAEAAANQFWRMHKVDLRRQAVEWQKLVFACERAKRMLSLQESAAIYVPEVLRSADGMTDLNIGIDRSTFDRVCMPIIERTLATCDEALGLVGMQPVDLSAVYLSGGTTYIPTVRKALAQHFGVPVRTGVPPEHAVCLGSAIHAAQLQFRAATTLPARAE